MVRRVPVTLFIASGDEGATADTLFDGVGLVVVASSVRIDDDMAAFGDEGKRGGFNGAVTWASPCTNTDKNTHGTKDKSYSVLKSELEAPEIPTK